MKVAHFTGNNIKHKLAKLGLYAVSQLRYLVPKIPYFHRFGNGCGNILWVWFLRNLKNSSKTSELQISKNAVTRFVT